MSLMNGADSEMAENELNVLTFKGTSEFSAQVALVRWFRELINPSETLTARQMRMRS